MVKRCWKRVCIRSILWLLGTKTSTRRCHPFISKRYRCSQKHQGRVVRKPVNVNPGLNVNWSIIFCSLKIFFTSNVWCILRLLQLKGRISRFSACPYTDWPVHAFWHRPRFFIVYEPIVSKLILHANSPKIINRGIYLWGQQINSTVHCVGKICWNPLRILVIRLLPRLTIASDYWTTSQYGFWSDNID